MDLIELHADSFRKLKGSKGYVLGIPNASNLTLVMFYSTQCEYCDQAIPELSRLSRHLRENNLPIQVAVCDVGKNRAVIKEAAGPCNRSAPPRNHLHPDSANNPQPSSFTFLGRSRCPNRRRTVFPRIFTAAEFPS